MTPPFVATMISYVPEYYPTFLAVLVGLAEALVILVGLGFGLRELLFVHREESTAQAEDLRLQREDGARGRL